MPIEYHSVRILRSIAVLCLVGGLLGCGGGSSTPSPLGGAVGNPAPTPTPAPTPHSTPEPTPEPTPEGTYPNGETVVVRATAKIEQVIGIFGQTRLNSPPEGTPVYVGETIRFDVTGKDSENNETDGSGALDPGWAADPAGVIQWNNPLGFNPRAEAIAPGEAEVLASLDGVRSETIRVVVVEHP
jgi:hypothetical protein